MLALPLAFLAYHAMLAPPPASVLMQDVASARGESNSGRAGRVASAVADAAVGAWRTANLWLAHLSAWVLRTPQRAVDRQGGGDRPRS